MCNLPFVSVIIPCRNEEKFIAKCLDSVIANDYPKNRLEILVVDGISEDGTRKIIQEYMQQHSFIRLMDNPRKITPVAFNIGIKNSEGAIISIHSAHAIYNEDYISKCIQYMNEYDADAVGGTMITIPREDTVVGRAIVHVLSCRFGTGNSVFRIGSTEPKWVDTVFGGCYKKEILEKIGLFNENLARSQDMDLNSRLKKSASRILFVPEIVSYYYARSDLRSFWKSHFLSGFWVTYHLKFTKTIFSLRHLTPLIFVLTLVGLLILAVSSRSFLFLFTLVLGTYVSANVYFSSRIAIRENNLKSLFVTALVFAARHFSYGLGSIWGIMRLFKRSTEH